METILYTYVYTPAALVFHRDQCLDPLLSICNSVNHFLMILTTLVIQFLSASLIVFLKLYFDLIELHFFSPMTSVKSLKVSYCH